MNPAHSVTPFQISNGAGDPEHPVITACGQPVLGCRCIEQNLPAPVRHGRVLEMIGAQMRIEGPAPGLNVSTGRHPGGGLDTALNRGGQAQVRRRDRRNSDLQVNPVQHGPGNTGLVIDGAAWTTAAGHAIQPTIAAAARIHGRDQLEAGWVGHMSIGPGHGDRSGFHWLAQAIENLGVEFRQFIQE